MKKDKSNKFAPLENFLITFMYGIGILTCSLIILIVFKFFPNLINTAIITSISMGTIFIAWSFIKLNMDINKKNEKEKKKE